MLSDHELLKRELKHNSRAQTEVYNTYIKRVLSSCYRIVKDLHHAEDFAQEAFIQAFDRIDRFRGESDIGTWICRIAINKCLDHLRKRKVKLELDESWEQADTRVANVDQDQIPYDVQRILTAMEALPEGCRVVFSLHLFEEMDHETIAKKLGIKPGSSRAQYARAKNKIKELVNETYV